jgi:HK97 family phage prohead protease
MELTRKLLDTSSVTLADQRLVTVICSTGEPDRMGDVIVQNGIDLTAYRKNPVVLWGHSADVPIAKAIEIDVKNGKLQATVQFPPEGDDEDADWVYGKIKAGIVNATSVGFIPKDYEPLDPKQPWGGFKFVKSELLEFSFVSIPANSGCLIVGRSLLNAVDVPMLPSRAQVERIRSRLVPE